MTWIGPDTSQSIFRSRRWIATPIQRNVDLGAYIRGHEEKMTEKDPGTIMTLIFHQWVSA
jgi:hypothetical protein